MAIIKISGDAGRIAGALGRLAALGREPRKFLAAVGDEMIDRTQARIEAGMTPDGEAFAPLDPLYAIRKKGPGILRESGMLFGTLNTQMAGNTLIWGSDRPYAAVHQFGAVIRGRDIPARPYLGFNAEDQAVVRETLEEFFAQCMGG